MNIFADWWAGFVAHKLRQNEQAAKEVKERLSPVEGTPETSGKDGQKKGKPLC